MGLRGCKAKYTDAQVVKVYREAGSLREAGERLGLSKVRVHQIVTRAAPQALGPRGGSWQVKRGKSLKKK